MSLADHYYREICKEIIEQGYSNEGGEVRGRWADGTPAYSRSVIGRSLRFDNSELPILTSKKVMRKSPIIELYEWMWRDKSNKVSDLRKLGSKIWNEWEMEDGTIGKAYGHQLGKRNQRLPATYEKVIRRMHEDGQLSGFDMHLKPNKKGERFIFLDQVDNLIFNLIHNPYSQRHIVMLWNPDELHKMALPPCVYETQWHVKGGKLHLEVRARSNDMGLGHAFNLYQHNVNQRLVARAVGLELGEYIFHIGDAHIYDRHIETVREQIENGIDYKAPELWINPDKKNYYDFTIDDFKLIDYQHGPAYPMEVTI